MSKPKPLSSQFDELQMFMTPKEIKAKYQPLDADRLDHDGSYEDRYVTRTEGSMNTAQSARGRMYTPGGRERAWTESDGEGKLSRSHVIPDYRESDDELWDRKLDESQYERDLENPRAFEPTGRSRTTGGRTNYLAGSDTSFFRYNRHNQEESLYDSIERGGVQKPISLGQKIGSEGKPQVVGGHHRLAAADAINPDQFVPVLHFENIQEAKKGPGGYKYT